MSISIIHDLIWSYKIWHDMIYLVEHMKSGVFGSHFSKWIRWRRNGSASGCRVAGEVLTWCVSIKSTVSNPISWRQSMCILHIYIYTYTLWFSCQPWMNITPGIPELGATHSFTVQPSQAYYRRAAGKQQLGDLDGAYEDLKLAAQMPGTPRVGFHRQNIGMGNLLWCDIHIFIYITYICIYHIYIHIYIYIYIYITYIYIYITYIYIYIYIYISHIYISHIIYIYIYISHTHIYTYVYI